MTLPLYFAPINTIGNASYRHLLLQQGADFVFSELIMVENLEDDYYKNKIILPAEDVSRTIFQIGAGSSVDVALGVAFLAEGVKGIQEININMGCPQSTLQKNNVCGGLLYNQELMGDVAKSLAEECTARHIIPSVKLRLGTSEKDILIDEFLPLLSNAGIKKVYIHLRPLRYNYTKPILLAPIQGLKEKHPDMIIILNGDVDSYERYTELTSLTDCDGIMIGRCALSNPLIFKQIKAKQETKKGPYDPLYKDPLLRSQGQHIIMDAEKQEIILHFITLAKDVPLSVLKANLSWLTKGVTARGAFIHAISQAQDTSSIIETFKEHFSS